MTTALLSADPCQLPESTEAFYRDVLLALARADAPFLVGGAYAFSAYTGIERHTKDIDLFIGRDDWDRVAGVLQAAGHDCELTYPHWLGKVHAGPVFVDLIFNSGNGLTGVDEQWFEHAELADVLGVRVKIMPAEEIVWSKAFIMERERYDGADIAHLLRARADRIDWARLLARFGPHWRVLLSHLTLFGFIYPGHRNLVPDWLMVELLDRLRAETQAPVLPTRLCQGTLLSREQYLHDVERAGYRDARLTAASSMTPDDVATWTEAIPPRGDPPEANG